MGATSLVPVDCRILSSSRLSREELEEDMDPHDLTMDVARRRVAERGDLFAPVLEDRQSIGQALRELA